MSPDAAPPEQEYVTSDGELDIDALLASPAESGDFDCSLPAELQAEFAEEGLETRARQAIDAACSNEFTAIRTSGTRALSTIRLIVIHCTESSAARGSARWFTDPRTQGSAHLVVDDHECYRTLGNDVIPWAAPGANTIGWHLELTGFAAWSRSEWLARKETLRRGAFKAARHAKRFGIPITMLGASDVRSGRKGFVTHALCTQVFGGDHTDPGRNFPADDFMQMAKEFRDGM